MPHPAKKMLLTTEPCDPNNWNQYANSSLSIVNQLKTNRSYLFVAVLFWQSTEAEGKNIPFYIDTIFLVPQKLCRSLVLEEITSLLLFQMVRSLAASSRPKTQRVILEDSAHASLTGKLFNETVNVSF